MIRPRPETNPQNSRLLKSTSLSEEKNDYRTGDFSRPHDCAPLLMTRSRHMHDFRYRRQIFNTCEPLMGWAEGLRLSGGDATEQIVAEGRHSACDCCILDYQ